jgi:AraC-like DNA-binding protein/mannose-6-phosphate isomerase-like protein (cupin superfamily)
MRPGNDIEVQFSEFTIIHHNKPGQQTPLHQHQEHQLIIPLRGEFRMRENQNLIAVGPGRMVYIPSQLPHEFLATNKKEGERIICLIKPSLWKRANHGTYPLLEIPVSQICKEILFYLLLNAKTSRSKILIRTFVEILGESLNAGVQWGSGGSVQHLLGRAQDERVKKAVAYLRESFSQPTLKVGEIAKASGLSSRNLSRLFVEEIGIGPKEVIICLRLEEARRLLEEGNLSVTEASLQVGYQSLSRFILAFRHFFGKLPSEI